MTQSTSAVIQGGRRKRTDLIPTIPIHRGDTDRSPRSPLYGSSSGASSSRGSVSRSTGMSVSLSRLDQLAKPRRRLVSSSTLQPLHETENEKKPAKTTPTSRQSARSMSKSMSHLAKTTSTSTTPTGDVVVVAAAARTTRAERLRQKARQASHRPNGGFLNGVSHK